MPSVHDAKRIAKLNFLRRAHRRRETRVAYRAEASTNLEECDAVELWIVRNAGHRQTIRRKVKTVGSNSIRVVGPTEPHTQIV